MMFLIHILLPFFVLATPFQEVKNIKVSSDKTSDYEAKKDLQEKAMQKATIQQIRQIVGQERYQSKKESIHKTILPKSKKFIVAMSSKPMKEENGLKVKKYNFKIDRKRLVNLLRKNGYFYSADSSLNIVPFVTFSDKVNFKDYYWWGSASPYQSKLGHKILRDLHRELKKVFKQKDFVVATPIRSSYGKKLKMEQQFLNISSRDLKSIARQFDSELAIRGEVKVKTNIKARNSFLLQYDLEVVQLGNMKILAKVNSEHITYPGHFDSSVWISYQKTKQTVVKDIFKKLEGAWSEGKVGSKLFQITLKGNLKYNQYKRFKRDLLMSIGTVNSIREKNFSPGAIVLELDAPSSLDEVVRRIQKSKFSKYKVDVKKENQTSLEMNVLLE